VEKTGESARESDAGASRLVFHRHLFRSKATSSIARVAGQEEKETWHRI